MRYAYYNSKNDIVALPVENPEETEDNIIQCKVASRDAAGAYAEDEDVFLDLDSRYTMLIEEAPEDVQRRFILDMLDMLSTEISDIITIITNE